MRVIIAIVTANTRLNHYANQRKYKVTVVGTSTVNNAEDEDFLFDTYSAFGVQQSSKTNSFTGMMQFNQDNAFVG